MREVERDGTGIDIEHGGKVVARIIPATVASATVRRWEALHGSGMLLSSPEESVLEERHFDASR